MDSDDEVALDAIIIVTFTENVKCEKRGEEKEMG